jgi:hypothetical protein
MACNCRSKVCSFVSLLKKRNLNHWVLTRLISVGGGGVGCVTGGGCATAPVWGPPISEGCVMFGGFQRVTSGEKGSLDAASGVILGGGMSCAVRTTHGRFGSTTFLSLMYFSPLKKLNFY